MANDKTPLNGHYDPDFADRLKPSRFDAPVRGGGLAGEGGGTGGTPPSAGVIAFLIVLVLVLGILAVAALKLGWLS